MEIIEIEVPHRIAGVTYDKINSPGEIMVTAITRLGRAFVPVVGTEIKEGDIMHVTVASVSITKLKGILGI